MQPENVREIELHTWLGARLMADQTIRFGVWAPDHTELMIDFVDQDRQIVMDRTPDGFHVASVDDVALGTRYLYRLSGGLGRPDPASRYQPAGVHGPSAVVDHAFAWTDDDWRGITREDLVIYELHLGCFTDQGTFLSAIDRLEELVRLGITAIELMPIATSAGQWNWGYDGVNLFAPAPNYGHPDDLRRLIDAAHAVGLAVILDVVYNHLGPEGNYLADFGPYFSDRHTTPWGAAPNFDEPANCTQVRRFFVANTIAWLDEYHFDGLRIDAIHCMRDDSDRHIVAQISDAVRSWSQHSGRSALLIAESNVYDPQMLSPRSTGGLGFDAEWCDDFLHSMFAVVRPGEDLCHRRYRADDLAQTLKYGFVYEGTLRAERGRCTPSERVDTRGLIYSIQNHDFVGNHPLGKRLHQLTDKQTQRAAATLLVLSPAIPMLFMGEEFACEHPFQFFVDFGDQHLRRAVVDGRKAEYPQHDWGNGRLPTDPETFVTSKIGQAIDGDQAMWNWYRDLLELRQQWRANRLLSDEHLSVTADHDRGLHMLKYADDHHVLTVAVRLTVADPIGDPVSWAATGECLLDSRGSGASGVLLANHAQVCLEKI